MSDIQNQFGNNLSDDDAMPVGVVKEAPVVPKATPNQLKKYAKRTWIVLEDNDQIPPTGQFIGHNGVGFILRPGEPAEVPVELLEILNNAVYSAPIVDQGTKQITGYRERLRFPYRVVPAPDRQAA